MSQRLSKTRRIELLLRVYAVLGAIVSVIAALYFALSTFDFTFTEQQTTAIIGIGVGLLLTLMSLGASSLLRYSARGQLERMRENLARSLLIDAWEHFEVAAFSAAERSFHATNTKSLRPLLYDLNVGGYLSDEEISFLKYALELRNLVVHSTDDLGSEDLREIADKLFSLSRRLERNEVYT
jgi:hypothetical protein